MKKPPILALVVSSCALVLFMAGCTTTPTGPLARKPMKPSSPDLTTPERSVRSYLEWTTYAYRLADSEVASDAMDPYWGVHVDSYIERMRQEEGKGIDQTLVRLQTASQSVEGTGAVVTAKEDWKYRYFSLKSETYVSPEYTISYDTTYTLSKEPIGWLVTDVQATPLGELK